jgi:hypothetical protein
MSSSRRVWQLHIPETPSFPAKFHLYADTSSCGSGSPIESLALPVLDSGTTVHVTSLHVNNHASAVVCRHHHHHDEIEARLDGSSSGAGCAKSSRGLQRSLFALSEGKSPSTTDVERDSRCPRQVAHRTRYFALISISVTQRRPGFHVLLSPIAIAILGRGLGGALLTLAGANPDDSSF